MTSVSVRDLSLNFGAVTVLDKLNLDIDHGEFLVLLGSSGCGKSTLLNCIAGLLDVSDGQIFIKDRNVTWEEPKDRGIGMVFQSYALYPQMTVEKNLSFGLQVAKIPQPEIDKRVKRASEILQIQPLLKRKPSELSGGQRQRVAIGRALVRDVDVFLFDEPLSNLDAELRVHMRIEIARLHKQLAATIVYVTHDQVEAMTLADKIVVMRGGVVEQVGSPLDLYDDPANLFVAGFIGSPGMNFFEGTHHVGDRPRFEIAGDIGIPLDAPAPLANNAKATLGIRPEHVVLAGHGPETLLATVDLVEPTGFGIILHLSLGRAGFKAFTNDRSFLTASGTIPVHFPTHALHFFDGEGNRV